MQFDCKSCDFAEEVRDLERSGAGQRSSARNRTTRCTHPTGTGPEARPPVRVPLSSSNLRFRSAFPMLCPPAPSCESIVRFSSDPDSTGRNDPKSGLASPDHQFCTLYLRPPRRGRSSSCTGSRAAEKPGQPHQLPLLAVFSLLPPD